MLNDFVTTHQFEPLREDDRNRLLVQMNSTLYSFVGIDSTTHLDNNSSNTITGSIVSSNSTSSLSKSDQQVDHIQQQQQQQPTNSNLEQFNHRHQDHTNQGHQSNYCTTANTDQHHNSVYTDSNLKFDTIATTSSLAPPSSLGSIFNTTKGRINLTPTSIADMNVNTNQHTNMIPTAHGSDHQMLYSQTTPKNLPVSSPSGIALNFSHDLLQQPSSHHILGSGGMHQHADNNVDVKPQLHNSFEIDSRSLMQSAVGMNMWKDMSQLNHFKHPAINDHNFLPASDLNNFTGWSHGNNLNHQQSSMAHNILDSQHLIGYPQHQQRSIPISNQDLGGSVVKSQSSGEQTSFMLNSINHKASTSQNSSSSHQTTQPIDNLSLRSDTLDHSASTYNLSMNDNHLYTSSRSDSRSQPNLSKSSVMSDRSVHMSLSHQGQLPYHQSNELSLQQMSHLMPGSSSGSSKSAGSFRCPHCNEVFPLRTVYQSHLKTHSQEKGKLFSKPQVLKYVSSNSNSNLIIINSSNRI